jgi:hypothetical protein
MDPNLRLGRRNTGGQQAKQETRDKEQRLTHRSHKTIGRWPVNRHFPAMEVTTPAPALMTTFKCPRLGRFSPS